MSDNTELVEGITHLLIGFVLLPALPLGVWFAVSRYWLAFGLLGIVVAMIPLAAGLTGAWSVLMGVQKVKA